MSKARWLAVCGPQCFSLWFEDDPEDQGEPRPETYSRVPNAARQEGRQGQGWVETERKEGQAGQIEQRRIRLADNWRPSQNSVTCLLVACFLLALVLAPGLMVLRLRLAQAHAASHQHHPIIEPDCRQDLSGDARGQSYCCHHFNLHCVDKVTGEEYDGRADRHGHATEAFGADDPATEASAWAAGHVRGAARPAQAVAFGADDPATEASAWDSWGGDVDVRGATGPWPSATQAVAFGADDPATEASAWAAPGSTWNVPAAVGDSGSSRDRAAWPSRRLAPPPSRSDSEDRCEAKCHANGLTCKDWFRWTLHHLFAHQEHSCARAYSKVQQECDACYDCSLQEIGCEEDAADSLDCGSDSSDPYEWTAPRRKHCCQTQGVACGEPAPAPMELEAGMVWVRAKVNSRWAWLATPRFDCRAVLVAGGASWSEQKKAYCCQIERRGCSS